MSVKRGIGVYLFLKSVSVRVRLTLTLTLDLIPTLRSRFRPQPRPLPRPHVLLTPLNLVPGAVLTLWHCFTNKRRKSSSVRFSYTLQKRKSRPERGRFFYIREPFIANSLRMFHIPVNHYSQSKDGVLTVGCDGKDLFSICEHPNFSKLQLPREDGELFFCKHQNFILSD